MPPARSRPVRKPAAARKNSPAPRAALEIVDPKWLAKALALSLAAALLCCYATLCLLVYQGAWQFVLHPSHTITQTPASAGLDYINVRFGASQTGQPQLTAWWIPAETAPQTSTEPTLQPIPKYAAFTVLYLHGGTGSLSNTVPMLADLHRAGLNIFAMDYRGFGASDPSVHPSDPRMTQDTETALTYLTSTRHIPTGQVIPYGVGLGAALAAKLALSHPAFPAVILDNPDPDPASTAAAAHPSRVFPVRLLFGKRFDIATPLETLATPKLLIAGGPAIAGTGREAVQLQGLFRRAASPRFAVTLPPDGKGNYQSALSRFLDQYLTAR